MEEEKEKKTKKRSSDSHKGKKKGKAKHSDKKKSSDKKDKHKHSKKKEKKHNGGGGQDESEVPVEAGKDIEKPSEEAKPSASLAASDEGGFMLQSAWSPFFNLPPEIHVHIFSFLSWLDVLGCESVALRVKRILLYNVG